MLPFSFVLCDSILLLLILRDRIVVIKAVSTSNHFRLTPYL